MKRILCALLAFALIIPAATALSFADGEPAPEPVYTYPKWLNKIIEESKECPNSNDIYSDGFAGNTPLESYYYFVELGHEHGNILHVVLKHIYSDPTKYTYTPECFPELDIKDFHMYNENKSTEEIYEKFKSNTAYRRIITITLGDGDTAESAITKLNSRIYADLRWVSCNTIYAPDMDDNGVEDINNDGKTNARDVVALMKGIVDGTATSDVNGDGKVNARDVTALMRAIGSLAPAE